MVLLMGRFDSFLLVIFIFNLLYFSFDDYSIDLWRTSCIIYIFLSFSCRVFLVRESHSIPDTYVLSLAHNYKVKHCQIHQVGI